MTDYEEHQIIREQIRQTDGYSSDRTFLVDLINQYENASREKHYEMHDKITGHAKQVNWSRRRLDTLLDDIVRDKSLEHSHDLWGFLMDMLDGLEGNCLNATRLNGDPVDDRELTSFGKWWRQEFYSDNG